MSHQIVSLLLLVFAAAFATCRFTFIPPQFSNHMILQRETFNFIFGNSDQGKGASVTLKILELGQVYSTQIVDANGYFEIKVDAHKAGGPYTFELSDKQQTVKFNDTLFGDVFLCSGQSNMKFTVSQVYNASTEMANAKYDMIRLMLVSTVIKETPQDVIPLTIPWSATTPSSVKYFSAACYFFGRNIYQSLNRSVPIGLIASSYGGTIVEAWMSKDALAKCGKSSNDSLKDDPPSPNRPSVLWNGMIYPLLKSSLKGFLWYQGEANIAKPKEYACLFPAMIADWRKSFKLGAPNAGGFYFVQLAPYMHNSLPEFRFMQASLVSQGIVPQSGVAVIVDLGDLASPYGAIHPRDKQDVGKRLALNALAKTYHFNVKYEGPNVTRVAVNYQASNTASVNVTLNEEFFFANTEQCTECCGSNHKEFEILTWNTVTGASKWEAAPQVAKVSSNTVQIAAIKLADANTKVKGVRFDWKAYPQCVMMNKERLPATPFVVNFN